MGASGRSWGVQRRRVRVGTRWEEEGQGQGAAGRRWLRAGCVRKALGERGMGFGVASWGVEAVAGDRGWAWEGGGGTGWLGRW